VFILDEVMTGFRVAYGGAQAALRDHPDLTCVGKIVGGGLPAAAFGGKAEIMDQLAPLGPGLPGRHAVGEPDRDGRRLQDARAAAPARHLRAARVAVGPPGHGPPRRGRAAGVPATVERVGSMLTLFFTADPVTDYASAKRCDLARFGQFFRGMRDRGVSLPPSQFEAMFVSLAHSDDDIDAIVTAAAQTLAAG
jgi:glutamate-1-semialdehyde 2,1-aminomutase